MMGILTATDIVVIFLALCLAIVCSMGPPTPPSNTDGDEWQW